MSTERLKIFTWHVHGSYLFYLSQGNYEIYIPTKDIRTEGYWGRGKTFPFADNVKEIPIADIAHARFDCILFQSHQNFAVDQFEILTETQRALPKIYIEHNTPEGHPTDTKHFVDDPDVLLVHVTYFNRLMWDNNRTPTRVIEHGVIVNESYQGDIEKGIVVINNLASRGRMLGKDIFEKVRQEVPIDLVGMGSLAMGGLGEVLHPVLPAFISRYRFFFNPIRYTSLGLSVCEAMMGGLPVVGLATTELASVIVNGESGYIHTNVDALIANMKDLIESASHAKEIGEKGKNTATKRFNIARFTNDWESAFKQVISSQNR